MVHQNASCVYECSHEVILNALYFPTIDVSLTCRDFSPHSTPKMTLLLWCSYQIGDFVLQCLACLSYGVPLLITPFEGSLLQWVLDSTLTL